MKRSSNSSSSSSSSGSSSNNNNNNSNSNRSSSSSSSRSSESPSIELLFPEEREVPRNTTAGRETCEETPGQCNDSPRLNTAWRSTHLSSNAGRLKGEAPCTSESPSPQRPMHMRLRSRDEKRRSQDIHSPANKQQDIVIQGVKEKYEKSKERQSTTAACNSPHRDGCRSTQYPDASKFLLTALNTGARHTPIEEQIRQLARLGVPLLPRKLVKEMVGLVPQRLSRGVFGSCYKGVDPRTGKTVVVKTFKKIALHSLLKETVCLQQLQGRGVQRLVGVCVQTCQLVTRFAGTTAEIYFRFQASLPHSLSVILQVARAVRGLHQAGFAHNDIKSDNVCVRESCHGPRVTLIDLGMALPLGTSDNQHAGRNTAEVERKHPWVAPELLWNSLLCSEASDVYSMAWLVLEVPGWQRHHVARPAVWALGQWVEHARQPHPEQRPSMDALVEAVKELRLEIVPFLYVRRGRCPNKSRGKDKGE
ncbi:Germinal center kinase 1 [Portunus trituberculatus]|uniref:Germinal center kinase 1 n=1 Tax=Portunus trituberculatus TaxID=210409 RepID=A0A5B7HCA4_PORTR|nr:Germinal center kinase 1 [Portunus trituberculatus]